MNEIGVQGKPQKWIQSLLGDRRHYGSVPRVKSDITSLSTGIPKDLVLGPAVFLLNINDIVSEDSPVHFTLYADYTTI